MVESGVSLHSVEAYLVSSIKEVAVSEDRSEVAVAMLSNIMVMVVMVCTAVKWDILCGTPRQVEPACIVGKMRGASSGRRA